MDVVSCDVSNNPYPNDLVEFSLVQYHLAPSLPVENVEDFGNVSSDSFHEETIILENLVDNF